MYSYLINAGNIAAYTTTYHALLTVFDFVIISEKDTLPTIPTQQGQTVYIGLPIYFVQSMNLIRV